VVAIPGSGVHGVHPTAMKSPFSNWAGESDAESQMNQARLKALGKRRKSHKKIALEVVEEAEKEGEEGMTTHAFFVFSFYILQSGVWSLL